MDAKLSNMNVNMGFILDDVRTHPAAENGAKRTLLQRINTLFEANNTLRQQNVQNVHLAMKEP